jgi:hypothetical protein
MAWQRTAAEAAAAVGFTAASLALVARTVCGALPPRAAEPAEGSLSAGNAVAPRRGRERPDPPERTGRPDAAAAEKLGNDWDSDAALAAHAEPVTDYSLSASLEPAAHVVNARGTLTWRNRSRTPVRALYVHLYLNAFKSPRSSFLSRRSGGGRGSADARDFGSIDVTRFSVREMGGADLWGRATRADPDNPDDETDMRVELPEPVQPGAEIHVDLAFASKLPSIVERSGYDGSFHMVAQWFPKIARLEPDGSFAHFPYRHLAEFYADFGRYDVTIDVPAAFAVGATGHRIESRLEAGRRIERFEQADVHDFAFAAWDGFERLERTSDGVALHALFPAGHGAVAEREIEAAAFGLRHFGRLYGRYPYSDMTVVHPPAGAIEAGGMEYPTLITTGGPWYAPPGVGFARSVTVHELGHQWFYGLVATDETRWPFLDEGLTTYAEAVAVGAGWGPGAVADIGGLGVGFGTALRWRDARSWNNDRIAQPAASFHTWADYGGLAYARTALALLSLDAAFGAGTMARALGRYARRYRFEHPEPSHLLGAVRDTAGEPAADALRAALFERGSIDYVAVSLRCDRGPTEAGQAGASPSSASTPASPARQRAHRCRFVAARRGSIVLPTTVQLVHDDGTARIERWDGAGNERTFELESASPVAAAVVDPGHELILEDDLCNNAIRREGPQRAWRVLERAAYAAQLGLAVVAP